MTDSNTEKAERREFFRWPDKVSLRYRVLSSEQFDAAVDGFEHSRGQLGSVASSLAATNAQMQRGLERFRPSFPELSSYLEGLNEKVDLVIKHLAPILEELPEEPTHEVNLSGNGLAMLAEEGLELGSYLELRILLFPEYFSILALGKVVRCELEHELPTPAYDVAVEFAQILEADRDLVIRHLMKRQSEQIRQQKNTS